MTKWPEIKRIKRGVGKLQTLSEGGCSTMSLRKHDRAPPFFKLKKTTKKFS